MNTQHTTAGKTATQSVGVTETLTSKKTRQIISYLESREDIVLSDATKRIIRLLVAETVVDAHHEGNNSLLKVLKERGVNFSEVTA